MRYRLLILLITFTSLSCKAQIPIISLFNGTKVPRIENAYYKDINNDFDAFIGTWKYTTGNEDFTIILDKKLLDFYTYYGNQSFYTDYMFGEFKYIDVSGNTLVNTIPNISNTNLDISEHQIFGNDILSKYAYPKCDDCLPDERRLRLSLTDPDRDYLEYDIILRTVPNTVNPTVSDLQVFVIGLTSMVPAGQPTESRIPYGEYLMIKQ